MIKKLNVFIAAALAAVCFSSCKSKAPEKPAEETSCAVTSATEPEPDHSLMRRFTINDVFAELSAEDIKFTFPIYTDEFSVFGKFSECKFEDNKIIFPSGKYLEAKLMQPPDKDLAFQPITFLRAEKSFSPEDFTAYGITFGMPYSTLVNEYGIPDQVAGDPAGSEGTCVFYGAEKQMFAVMFKNAEVCEMSFAQ